MKSVLPSAEENTHNCPQAAAGRGVHLEGICSLAGLADEDAHVIPENGRLAVQQV